MQPRAFRLTDEYSIEQFKLIKSVFKSFKDTVEIAYHSNWYIIIACADLNVATELENRLNKKAAWNTEISPGKRNKVRHYIRIQLLRN